MTTTTTIVKMSKMQISREHEVEPSPYTKNIDRYTTPGNYEDEITMVFDDEKQLYVSKIFLRHVSHVFDLMFDKNSEYVENKNGTIKMVDKSYANVRELLYHLDPNIQKEVEPTNVFEIIPLAEEYMIVGSIRKCRICLISLLVKDSNGSHWSTPGYGFNLQKINNYQREIVDVLLVASKYGYKDIHDRARQIISKWKSVGSNWPQCYDRIPRGDKLKILEYRLSDKGDVLVPF